MKTAIITLDEFLARYAMAPMDTKQAMLAAGMKAQPGVERNDDEPYLTLTELTSKLGYRHYTSLWRLGIKASADNFGGRPRYKVSKAIAFLQSPEGAAIRKELRAKRHAQYNSTACSSKAEATPAKIEDNRKLHSKSVNKEAQS